MNVKRILIGLLIVIAIVASVNAVSAGLFDGLLGEEQQDNIIEIENIKFNTTNVTKFELYNKSNANNVNYKWYWDENHTGYNVHIYNFSKIDDLSWSKALEYYKGDSYDNIPSQTTNGVVVYTTTANVGDHVGEPRYKAYVENRDLKTIVEICTPDANETAKMALSLKFK